MTLTNDSEIRIWKSAEEKLSLLSRQFGFRLSQGAIEAHELLGSVRRQAIDVALRLHVLPNVLLPRFHLAWMQYGPEVLHDTDFCEHLLEQLAASCRKFPVDNADNREKMSILPHGLSLRVMEEPLVNRLMANRHFLGYGRERSLHLGLYAGDGMDAEALGIATLSTWDLEHISSLMPRWLDHDRILILSRLLTFQRSPRNTVSKLMSKLYDWLPRNHPGVDYVVTYCNPNAGHYGTSYRGSNFLPLCHEIHPSFIYEAGQYLSPRKFADRLKEVPPALWSESFRRGRVEPLPLLLYILPLRKSLNRSISNSHVPFSAGYPYSWLPTRLSEPTLEMAQVAGRS